jgi:hypothetical protein
MAAEPANLKTTHYWDQARFALTATATASLAVPALADGQAGLAAARLCADEPTQRRPQRGVQQRMHTTVNRVHDEGDGCRQGKDKRRA